MKRSHLLPFLIVTLELLVAAGCGGGASESDVAALRAEVQEVKKAHAQLVATVAELEKRAQAAPAGPVASIPPPSGPRIEIPVGPSPTLGKPTAPITVVEFADFQCPYCKAAAGLPAALVAEYPEDVRVVFKNYPFGKHSSALIAARAAWAAHQQGKFWEMYNLIYAGDINAITPEVLRGYAEQVGLDMKSYEKDAASPKAAFAVTVDKKFGRRIKIPGTPAYFVNGRPVVERNAAGVRRMVAEELARVKSAPGG